MSRFCCIMAILAACMVSCDRKDELPPEVVRDRQEAERRAMAGIAAFPTTRELAEAPRARIRLGTFPLTIEAPKSWRLTSESEGALVTLTGSASSGTINIQLVQVRQPVSQQQIESLLASARREAEAKPHPINRVQLRDLGPAKVLEQRMISTAFVDGKPAPERTEDVEVKSERSDRSVTVRQVAHPTMVKWNLTVFVPEGGKYVPRGLNFMVLKLSEYERDKEFLEKLVSSLEYSTEE